ncbi:hypothetical protein X975_10857, partial [Stegodyphus mimosarum]
MDSESTDLTNQSKRKVFLLMLTVYVENENSKQLVRAIIDTGSQKSYISKYVAKTIGLKSRGEERITHGLFGGKKITSVHDRYMIKLCSFDEKLKFVIEVSC